MFALDIVAVGLLVRIQGQGCVGSTYEDYSTHVPMTRAALLTGRTGSSVLIIPALRYSLKNLLSRNIHNHEMKSIVRNHYAIIMSMRFIRLYTYRHHFQVGSFSSLAHFSNWQL